MPPTRASPGIDLAAVPRTGGPSEEELIKRLGRQQQEQLDPSGAPLLYEDPDFSPSSPTTLYVDPARPPEYATVADGPEAVAWYRPTEYADDPDYFKSPSGCGVLREGALGDAWLLGVLAAVALHPDNLIENLFVSDSLDGFKHYGLFTCRFYKNAQWVTVTTDTRVPYNTPLDADDLSPARGSASPGHLLYGAAVNKNEVFVPFLEKAYAKLHGSYEALAAASDGGGGGGSGGGSSTGAGGGGSSSIAAAGGGGGLASRILEAFLDCTGGSAHRVDLVAERGRALHDDTLWRRLVRYHRRKCIVTAQLRQLSFNAYDLTPTGILKNRQYVLRHVKEVSVGATGGPPTSNNPQGAPPPTVLRFVKLKNVWGRGMWKGEWSNDDSKWEEHLQVEHALRNDPACEFSRSGADGCFWMIWEDFVETFSELFVTHVFGNDDTYQYCVAGEWLGVSAAGAPQQHSQHHGGLGLLRPTTTHASTHGDSDQPPQQQQQSSLSSSSAHAVATADGAAVFVPPPTAPTSATPGAAVGAVGGGGGSVAPPASKGERAIDRTKWAVLPDAEPNWHRNPQFKLTVAERTPHVLVSLTQRDFRLFGGDNYAINFVLLRQKANRTAIVWECKRGHVVAEAHSFEASTLVSAVGAGATAGAIAGGDHAHHPTTTTTTTAAATAAQAPGTPATMATPTMSSRGLPERELVREELVLEPHVAYFLVPYTDHPKVEMEFFLRVFAPKPVRIEPLPAVCTRVRPGKWRNDEDAGGGGGAGAPTGSGGDAVTTSSAGGPLCIGLSGGEENGAWCQNPQYWLRLRPMGLRQRSALLASRSGATVKLILRKTSVKAPGAGGGGAKSRQRELQAREKQHLVGLTVVRGRSKVGGSGGGGAEEMTGKTTTAMTHAGLLRAQAKAPKTNFLGEIVDKPQWKRDAKRDGPAPKSTRGAKGHGNEHDELDMEDDDVDGLDPTEEEADAKDHEDGSHPTATRLPPPRVVVEPDEWCRVSEYASPVVACLALRRLPKDWLVGANGGLVVVPTLGEPGAEGTFELQVDADLPVLVDELPRLRTQSVPGEWTAATAVGCHLHPEWKKNPKCFLYLKGVRPARVQITVTRSELEWRAKCKRDAVGTMLGFYLFAGQRLVRAGETGAGGGGGGGRHPSVAGGGGPAAGASGGGRHPILVQGRPWSETDFVPLHSVTSPPELVLPAAFNEPYVIMPATYDPGKTGRFVVTVQCDAEFTLSADEP